MLSSLKWLRPRPNKAQKRWKRLKASRKRLSKKVKISLLIKIGRRRKDKGLKLRRNYRKKSRNSKTLF